ncbi:MAG: putative baseplate assembly protein [Nitrospirota bacterium]|nr:putative baseplate assembly protein [Nitrospirota bacterium]
MNLPRIDNRTANEVAAHIKETAPFYAPEWNPSAPRDAGAALTGLFGEMVFEVIHRLNRVPERHLAAFLDLLGLKQIPPQPAETVVAFTLAKDAKVNVLVPAGTQVTAAKTEEHAELTFETTEDILATPAKIKALYSAIPDRAKGQERVYRHTDDFTARERFEIFHGDVNVQEHSFFLRHSELLSVKSGAKFTLTGFPTNFASLLDWYYTAPGGQAVKFVAGTEAGNLTLSTAAGKPETASSTVNNVKGVWITVRPATGNDGTSSLFTVKDAALNAMITIGAESPAGVAIYPDDAFANDVPLDLTRGNDGDFSKALLPFGDKPAALATFYLGNDEVFSKKGAQVTVAITSTYAGNITVDRVQGIGATYASRLQAAGIYTAADVMVRTDAEIAAAIRQAGRPVASYLTRARNLREATAKEYYDKTGVSGPAARALTFPMPGLSWEYWNGDGWTTLEDVQDTTARLLFSGTLTFTCPEDIASTKVAGQEGYWIRVRLVTGNYGKELEVVDGQVIPLGFTPPMLERVTLSYEHQAANYQAVEAVLSRNNLEWEDGLATLGSGSLFKPFRPLPDEKPTFYMGFDRPLSDGPISLFFNLVEQDYPRDFRPLVRWEAYDPVAKKWQKLDAEDNTADMTRAGLVQVIAPDGGEARPIFSENLYWVRAVLAKGEFVSPEDAANKLYASGAITTHFFTGYLAYMGRIKASRKGQVEGSGIFTGNIVTSGRLPDRTGNLAPVVGGCAEGGIKPQDVRFIASELKKAPPLAKGLSLNAVKVRELVTVKDERVGSGSGLPDQSFFLAKKPVFEEEVWANEFGIIPKAELDAMKNAQPELISEMKDRQGNVKEIWVRWEGREDLLESRPTDRHYALDRSTGEIVFGDGKKGRVLPDGKNNLKATYKTGGGTAGNIDSAEIARLKTAIPLVDKATNPEAAGGGVQGESVEAVYRRGPSTIRHRYRAVTAEDYENLIREAFPGMARVKCLTTFNDQGKIETGWVTVILVPESREDRPLPSVELRRRVEDFLAGHAANVVTSPRHAVVTRPSYLKVSVTSRVVPLTVDLAPSVETAALESLQEFLHPLRGGWSGSGWPFGRMVCYSDLYALLEGLDGVDRVESLAISVTDELGTTRELKAGESESCRLPEYVLVCSGTHKVEAR